MVRWGRRIGEVPLKHVSKVHLILPPFHVVDFPDCWHPNCNLFIAHGSDEGTAVQ